MSRRVELGVVAAVWLLVVACQPASQPPVIERSPVPAESTHYEVRRGDTLYSIAWRFGLDYRDLAARNGIGEPYRIHPGRMLRLRGPRAQPAADAPTRVPDPEESSDSESSGPTPPAAARATDWRWPVRGRVVRDFGPANRGIDIRVTVGTAVSAAGSGEVVYAGEGLRGFRRLVIIKHDQTYLSAYSLNHPIAVAERQRVAAGAKLAELDAEGAVVHFEIRKNGKPVNPRTLIGPP